MIMAFQREMEVCGSPEKAGGAISLVTIMSQATDEMLMLACGKGDESAFTELVTRHQNRVYGTVFKMIGSVEDAEDVAQEIFIRLHKAAPHYRPEAKFTTWLYTICRNCVFSHCKRAKRHRTEPLEWNAGEEGYSEAPYEDLSVQAPSKELLDREMAARINAAISRLPESQRLALVLRQYEQLDYEEIAQVLDTTVSSVKSLLFRARDTLRNELKAYLSETS
jgi:RNA polymerase sigma-70 factor (ECF subfamily)